jgi:hypothetical protein
MLLSGIIHQNIKLSKHLDNLLHCILAELLFTNIA